jgi:tetratricopeptide (TPR) repeat protein
MLNALAALLLLSFAESPEKIMAQAKVKEGQALLSSERYAEAAQVFSEAIKLDPVLTMAHYGLGQSYMALKEYPKAVTAFQGAVGAFHSAAAESMTLRLENENQRQRHIRNLQDLIRQNSERPLAQGSREARVRDQRIQQWEMEIAMFERSQGGHAVPKTPPSLSLALGSAHFRSGQMADAEKEYRAALEVQPTLGEPRNNLAVVLLLTGRAADAKKELTLAEKNGFKAPQGLKQDIDAALAKAPPAPNR